MGFSKADESRPGQAAGGGGGRLQRCGKSNRPEVRRAGTGAIRQEFLINSRLSAPQAPGMTPCACPARRNFGTLRFSHIFADARRTPMPPAPVCFLAAYNIPRKCRSEDCIAGFESQGRPQKTCRDTSKLADAGFRILMCWI